MRPARVLVVDNAAAASAATLAAAHGALYQPSLRNIGGAGGFALGMLLALAGGADMVWLWDDDGWPESPDCLEVLLAFVAARGAAIAAPLVISAEDPARTAFGFRLGGRSTFERARVAQRAEIIGMAHLFNGTLIPAATIDRFGIPDTRLFMRGDEVDFMFRVMAGGGLVATVAAAIARHPPADGEVHSLLGGRLFAVCPHDPTRRALLFRNRGYVMRRHGRWGMLLLDAVRYAMFFLGRRRPDFAGYAAWVRLTWQGARERLGVPDSP